MMDSREGASSAGWKDRGRLRVGKPASGER